MDIRTLLRPAVPDRRALAEFAESLEDHAPEIERLIARLRSRPTDREPIAALFRAAHNIKGDAALGKIEVAVAIVHPIEAVLARLRDDEIAFSDVLAEALLLAVDRLELTTDHLLAERSLADLQLPRLIGELERLAGAPADKLDACAGDLIEAVTGFRPAAATTDFGPGRVPLASPSAKSQQADDLRFFRSLADRLEARSLLFKGRTLRLLRLASETNLVLGKAVDPIQLEAAVYVHDVGMMFLPESVWLKVERMDAQEKQMMQTHPAYGAGILSRIEGWQSAAEMVAQHHEAPDGSGYPNAIKAQDIHPGAKILAIVDAFEAVMLKHIHRGKNRSLLRAIAEINACQNQFAPEWIAPFNAVIRRTMEG